MMCIYLCSFVVWVTINSSRCASQVLYGGAIPPLSLPYECGGGWSRQFVLTYWSLLIACIVTCVFVSVCVYVTAMRCGNLSNVSGLCDNMSAWILLLCGIEYMFLRSVKRWVVFKRHTANHITHNSIRTLQWQRKSDTVESQNQRIIFQWINSHPN